MNTPEKIKLKLKANEMNIFSSYVDCILEASIGFVDFRKLDIFIVNKILIEKLSIFMQKKMIPTPTKPVTISIPTEQALALFIVHKVTNIKMGVYDDVVIQKIINQIHKEVIV